MPKEVIHDEAGMYDMVVGWSRGTVENETHEPIGGYVQLGIETSDGASLVEKLRGMDVEEAAMFTRVWGTLDRAGCNRAIRTLRRARDQAFGRDE